MAGKIFRNLDEQIEILKDKGLVINDYEKAKEILFKENYFFISGYRHFFTLKYKDRNFIKGTTFEELYSVFYFDRKIRNIFFKNLLIVENNIKSIISYQLSKKYGYKEKEYLDPKNFTQDSMKVRQVKDVLTKMKRQISVNGKKHTATIHYINNYGYIPMWILVKVLSFGIVSELYCILKYEDQVAIADVYGLKVETLKIYLSFCANFRNLCAHEEILYDYRTQRMIPDDIIHQKLNINKTYEDYDYGKNDLFALLICLNYLLNKNEFRELVRELGYEVDVLSGKIKVLPIESILNKVGFPSNWYNII